MMRLKLMHVDKREPRMAKLHVGRCHHVTVPLVHAHTKSYQHNSDVIISPITSQITGVSMVCSAVCSGADERKHQSYMSLDFVRGINRWLVNSPYKGPVTRKMFPFDDVIMKMPCITSTMISQSCVYSDSTPQLTETLARWSIFALMNWVIRSNDLAPVRWSQAITWIEAVPLIGILWTNFNVIWI